AGITGIRHVFAIEPKAGEYQFAARSSLADVLRKIKSGKIVTYKVSVPEGFTTWQVLERLKAHEVLTGEIEKVPLEGELLPDTYVFSRGRTRQSIIDQMQAAQLKLIEKLWPTRASDLPFETPQQALILASIVEKETGVADERARVAAVFVNRMRKGMRLQSDPTIIYGITKGQGKLERPIYRSDINEKTEYNTYQINGLPPTPIANAGAESIKAVLNPIESDELFFVADGTGGHVFAKTLAEHNENVKKWRTWLKDRDKEKDEQQADQDQNQELAAVEEQATNTDAPLPAIAGAVEAPTETAKPSAVEADDGKIPTFKFVKVAGRDVPIPKAKPVR
ncbi:MAG: endolytic transglycosylase MltG, partial [Anderseniella sp.]